LIRGERMSNGFSLSALEELLRGKPGLLLVGHTVFIQTPIKSLPFFGRRWAQAARTLD
jgi:hypothetical protein